MIRWHKVVPLSSLIKINYEADDDYYYYGNWGQNH